tara:strand:+ start:30003 stop:31682 length:1680 start_codon:yes stop_codon:yes gene_type:complete
LESIKNRNKILIIFLLVLLMACNSASDYSFKSLLKAFNSWISIHSNESLDDLNSKNFFIRNKKGTSEYFSEYFFDLKRFKLELFQIDKKSLNNKNRNIHIALNEKINSLLYSHSYSSYTWDPIYYIEPLNNYLLNLLLCNNLGYDMKIQYIDDALDYIPLYFNRTKKTLLSSNDYFIKRAISEINITQELLENIPLYIDFNDTVFIDIEKKIYNNVKFMKSYEDWLESKKTNEALTEKRSIAKILNNALFDIENKYNYSNSIDSLELKIKMLKKDILHSASIIYFADNSIEKTILENYEDSTASLYYILDKNSKPSNINKDYSSQVIYFNDKYKKLLESFDIIDINEIEIEFPYYNTLFELFENSIFIINPYYSSNPMNVIINSYNNSDLFKTEAEIFLVEEVLSRTFYFNDFSDSHIDIYNDINHYSWSKFLSTYIDYKDYNIIDQNYRFLYKLDLLQDFLKILIKYKYYNNEISKEDAIFLLINEGFIDKKMSSKIFEEIIYNYVENDLEKFISYMYLYDLFNDYCLINKKMSEAEFIKKIFKHGFLPIYNYKTVLN